MNDQGIGSQVLGISRSRRGLDRDIFAGTGPEPAGNLYGSDVVALPVVGASFRDQNLVAVLKAVNVGSAKDGCLQKSLVTGHQD